MNCPPPELQVLLDNCTEQSHLLTEAAELLAAPESWVDVSTDREQRVQHFKAITGRLLKMQRRYEEHRRMCTPARDGEYGLAEAEQARTQAFQSAMDALQSAVAQTQTSKATLLQNLGTTNHSRQMLSAYSQK